MDSIKDTLNSVTGQSNQGDGNSQSNQQGGGIVDQVYDKLSSVTGDQATKDNAETSAEQGRSRHKTPPLSELLYTTTGLR